MIKFNSRDIAEYLDHSDYSRRVEHMILNLIWNSKEELLELKNYPTKQNFFKAVYHELLFFDKEIRGELQEINRFLKEIKSTHEILFSETNKNKIESILKQIKLKLLYNPKTLSVKLKLNKILELEKIGDETDYLDFINLIDNSLKNLNLKIYYFKKQEYYLNDLSCANFKNTPNNSKNGNISNKKVDIYAFVMLK